MEGKACGPAFPNAPNWKPLFSTRKDAARPNAGQTPATPSRLPEKRIPA